VAAVCYRERDHKFELLLVRTRKGRWTFPKGGAIPGLTYSQAAALEAFEEGGVRGRVEQSSFTQYVLNKQSERSEKPEKTWVRAFLCEVIHLDEPQEPNRQPTWFSASEADRRLRECRTSVNGEELARVLWHAVARVDRLQTGRNQWNDELQKVPFEASEIRNMRGRTNWSGQVRDIRQVGIQILHTRRDVPDITRTRLQLLPSRSDREK